MTLRSHVNQLSQYVNGVSGCLDADTPGMIVVMYVVKVPNRGSPPAILLRESYREAGKVKNRTLANLSSWPEAKVEALSRVLKGQPPPAAALDEAFEITRSLPHGHVAAVLGTARQLGLEELIDPEPSRHRDLVTAMAVAQVIAPDSKLAIARGLRGQTAASSLGEVLHLGSCDEDDLYAAMDYLHRPAGADPGRAGRPAPGRRHPGAVRRVLCRVRGADLPAGRHRPPQRRGAGPAADRLRAADLPRGHPGRDRGLQGQHRRPGDRGRPGDQGQGPVRDREGGAGRGPGHADRRAAARGRPARRTGLDHRAARPSGQEPGPRRGPAADPVRYPGPGRDHLPGLPRRAADRLQEPVPGSRAGPQARIAAGRRRGRPGENSRGLRAGPAAAARPGQDRGRVDRVLARRKVARHFTVEITDDSLRYARDQDSIAAEAALDGIYVLRTSVAASDLDSGDVVSSYKALAQVERAFRAFNTDLDIRPIRHRTEARVRAHVFLRMLSYYLSWHMQARLAPLLFTDDDKPAVRAARSSPVTPAARSPRALAKAATKQTPGDLPVHSFATLLADLGTICLNTIAPADPALPGFRLVTTPTALQREAFELLGVSHRLGVA